MGGISIWQLLIVLGIVVLVFGTKKIRNLGGDLGSAVKGFKDAVSDGEKKADDDAEETPKESLQHQESAESQNESDKSKSSQNS